ncbi:TrbL/VirB6 plasmid conjugal transfer protein (plasmid) [Pararobbsia alpina]|uniref:type IV secretion system protein n=1 Tax=Pararobbsia alpina TaxID=621374 RepID=UPI0039A56067
MSRSTIFRLVLVLFTALAFVRPAMADTDDSTSALIKSMLASGASAAAPTGPAAGTTGAAIGQSASDLSKLFGSVLTSAATLSQKVRPESDKLIFGLGVITIVLAAIRFSATHNPISAWVDLIEELVTLSLFCSCYLAYTSVGPAIISWFQTLANDIGGGSVDLGVNIAKLSGSFYDAMVAEYHSRNIFQIGSTIVDTLLLGLAFAVLCVASVVFTFFTNMGRLQGAIGIVVGPIALALGASAYTRGYFKTWLDYLISAGMYFVVAAAMTQLAFQGVITDLQTWTNAGTTTNISGGYALSMSLYILLMSFEIPSIAKSIFGGGAGAGSAGIRTVASAAKGAAGLVG